MRLKYSLSLVPLLVSEIATATLPEEIFRVVPVVTKANQRSKSPGVLNYSFFVGPVDNLRLETTIQSRALQVANGERFGVIMRLEPTPQTRLMTITLKVPSSPENFPCSSCTAGVLTILPEQNAVRVVMPIESLRATAGFYWGIDAKDPRGIYSIVFAMDGVLIDSYTFEVK